MSEARTAQMEKLLAQEVAATDRLLALIQEERRIIEEGPQALIQLSQDKQSCLDQLAKASLARCQFLEHYGWPSDQLGMQAAIDQLDCEQRLAGLWQELIDKLEQCRKDNRQNGMMIESRRRQVRSALDLLQNGAPQQFAYGADGESVRPQGGRSLAKA